jgi:hypothetical protein
MPAHTPINYLKAGGSSFFSAECQKLLIAAGLNPDWFGSYDYVNNKITTARNKVNRWNAMSPAEQNANPGAKPTPEDHFLADSTTGHVIQDGVYRTARDPYGNKGRENPCARLVDGYVHDNAPCVVSQGVPAHGSPGTKIAGSVEYEMGQAEDNQRTTRYPAATTSPPLVAPERTYNSAHMTADENARSKTLVDRQQPQWNNVMARPGVNGPPINGSGPNGTVNPNNPAEVEAARQAIGAKPIQEPTNPNITVSGNTAEECINAWREKAKQAMQTSALSEEIKKQRAEANRAAADPNRVATLQARRAAAQARATAAENRAAGLPPGSAARRRAEAEAAAARRRVSQTDDLLARNRPPGAQQRLNCLEDARNNIRGKTNNNNGRLWP